MFQSLFEISRKTDIVNDKACRLGSKNPVDARNGLHQAMSLHWLVDIKRVHTGRVKTSQPHVSDDHELQIIRRIAIARPKAFETCFRTYVRLERCWILCCTCHDNFHSAIAVFICMPFRTCCHDTLVDFDADPARHANNHGFAAIHCFQTGIEMFQDIRNDSIKPWLGPHQLFKLRPL